jgi:peptidoglycan hydrolase CwlO-like protein
MADDNVRQSDITRLENSLNQIQKDINQILVPVAEMAVQVSHNEESIVEVKDGLRKWENRIWAIVVILILELVGLVLTYMQGAV